MNSLIRTFMVAFLIAASIQANAKVKLGVKAGLNVNNISQDFSDSDFETKTKMKLGYHVGATVDFGFSDAISLQTGLLFSSKGYSIDLEDGLPDGVSVDGYRRTCLNYIEIPINFVYKINNFQIYAGPYVAIGIGGKSKWDYTLKGSGSDESEVDDAKIKAIFGSVGEGDVNYLEGESAYSALDYGVNAGIGYKVGPILINAGYSLGLGNLQPDIDELDFDPKDFKASNRVITLSASFFFGKE